MPQGQKGAIEFVNIEVYLGSFYIYSLCCQYHITGPRVDPVWHNPAVMLRVTAVDSREKGLFPI